MGASRCSMLWIGKREQECSPCRELFLRLQDPHMLNMTHIDLFDLMEMSLFFLPFDDESPGRLAWA